MDRQIARLNYITKAIRRLESSGCTVDVLQEKYEELCAATDLYNNLQGEFVTKSKRDRIE